MSTARGPTSKAPQHQRWTEEMRVRTPPQTRSLRAASRHFSSPRPDIFSTANAGGITWTFRVAGSNPAGHLPVAQRLEHEAHLATTSSSCPISMLANAGGTTWVSGGSIPPRSNPDVSSSLVASTAIHVGECRRDYTVRALALVAGGRRFDSAPGQPGSSAKTSRLNSSPAS